MMPGIRCNLTPCFETRSDMTQAKSEDQALNRLQDINNALISGAAHYTKTLLATLSPAELGRLLESLPRDRRYIIWQLAYPEDRGETLSNVNDEVRSHLIDIMENDELLAATTAMDMDDLADVFKDLPEAVARELMISMDSQDRQRLESILSYPENSAGGLMNIDIVTVRADVTIDVVLRYLRIRKELPELTDTLWVVNRQNRFMGTLSLSALLTNDPTLHVRDIMSVNNHALLVTTSAQDVARHFELHDLISVPVVDPSNQLLGRITIDDVVDVIRDEADQDLMRMAGLNEENDMFAPILQSVSKRAVWLGINLLTALLASWVIGLYETTLDKIVALAVLMPIVASMGGIAGSQTLTLVIRGIALGQLGQSNTRLLLFREISVGMLNGILWSTIVAIVVYLWFGNLTISAIIAAALIINLIFATLAGVMVPLALKELGIDPALAGSVLLTTITDIIGFVAFLGLATLILL